MDRAGGGAVDGGGGDWLVPLFALPFDLPDIDLVRLPSLRFPASGREVGLPDGIPLSCWVRDERLVAEDRLEEPSLILKRLPLSKITPS